MPDTEYNIPNDPDVTPEDIEPGADLRETDLTDAKLGGADLTDASLRYAELTDAKLGEADLTDAFLYDADLTDAKLGEADLTDAFLSDADLTGADLEDADLTGADLLGADLTEADLFDADLTDAYLRGADLPGANLPGADLTDAVLESADLTEAGLRSADLTGADLRNADLTEASLRKADLTEAALTEADLKEADLTDAGLRGVNLSRADLRDVDMIGISANQGTTVGRMCIGLSSPDEYDELAQGYHELKERLSQEGLSQRAREARALEQQARTAEAWGRFKQQALNQVRQLRTLNAWRQWLLPPWPGSEVRTQFLTAVGGKLSRYLTGHGTRPLYVLLWTAAIVLVTTVLFALGPAPADEWQGGPLYYSVVTFVTAPPHPPRDSGIVTRTAVLIETYVGTALIVLLGYVLGTRERV